MTLEELKEKIETNTLDDSGLIFCFDKSSFLVNQYVNEIAKIKNKTIEYYEFIPNNNSFFGQIKDDSLSVVNLDKLDYSPEVPENCIVITKSKIDGAIIFPELEQWQIKDYVFSIGKGCDKSVLEKLVLNYDNIFKLENELDKILIFNENDRNKLSIEFIDNNVFSGINKVNIFDLSNAIQNKDKKSVKDLYKYVDKEPMSICGLLLKQFRNMINVYLQNYPNEENTGLKEKQIWAIKNVCKKYTKSELLSKFKFLLGIDYKLKSGYIPSNLLFDYILINILS